MNLTDYDPDRLWLKARLFINRAMDSDREFEECAFWAAASLELLGKAALSSISPLLIANPNDDGKSLMIASGVTEDRGGFSSVQAKAIWSRCQRAFKPFNELDAAKISAARNDYLHAAGIGFDKMPENWWPRYWSQAAILISHLDKEVADFVGPSRERIVSEHLKKNQEHLAARLETLLERARQRLVQHENETMSPRLRREWASFSTGQFSHHASADCPACGAVGRLEGEEATERRVEHGTSSYGDEDDYFDDAILWLVIGVDMFACPKCHLLLDDYDLILASGIPDTFEVEGDLADYYDTEYNNE